MDSVWMKIKRFLIFWGCVLVLLTLISLVLYSDYIFSAVTETFTAAILPLIVLAGIILVVCSALR